jgi:hypothetical protein
MQYATTYPLTIAVFGASLKIFVGLASYKRCWHASLLRLRDLLRGKCSHNTSDLVARTRLCDLTLVQQTPSVPSALYTTSDSCCLSADWWLGMAQGLIWTCEYRSVYPCNYWGFTQQIILPYLYSTRD